MQGQGHGSWLAGAPALAQGTAAAGPILPLWQVQGRRTAATHPAHLPPAAQDEAKKAADDQAEKLARAKRACARAAQALGLPPSGEGGQAAPQVSVGLTHCLAPGVL